MESLQQQAQREYRESQERTYRDADTQLSNILYMKRHREISQRLLRKIMENRHEI